MSKTYVLYNPLANNGRSREDTDKLVSTLDGEYVLCDMTKGYDLSKMDESDALIICGGDGTLNRFINEPDFANVKGDILYYANGSGNDFARDIGLERGDRPVSIKKYLVDLPSVEVKGRMYKFLNGVGYGIDGYCCEEGDRLRAIPGKKVDYTAIAIKGLLGAYKAKDARVIVDGVEHTYKRVWIAPTMHGKHYGGGMIPTPAQDRSNESGKLSLMVWHNSGKLATLMAFPSIFKGEHTKKTKMIEILEGYEITVEFSAPSPLQIDGETVVGVSSYTARSGKLAKVNI